MKFKRVGMALTAAILALGIGGAVIGCGEKNAYNPVDMTESAPAQIPDGFLTPEEISTVEPPDEGTEPWIPDIIDRDEPNDEFLDDFDDSQTYVYSRETVTLEKVNGGILNGEDEGGLGNYVTTGANSMAVSTTESAPFPYGTITCSVKTKTNTDSGIVFGLNSNVSSFWEGSGISYYFFFLGRDGTAYLGKTDNGIWAECHVVTYAFNANDFYRLKVVYIGNKICCYVNDELMFGIRDNNSLKGTRYGVRSGASGVEFKDLTITNEYRYD